MNQNILKETIIHSLKGSKKFPEIVGMLIAEKVEAYHVDFIRAENRYYDAHGKSFVISVDHEMPEAAEKFSVEGVKAAIKRSQQGLINYPTFIREVTEAGCVYYIAYLTGKRVLYLGRNGDSHTEFFPGAK